MKPTPLLVLAALLAASGCDPIVGLEDTLPPNAVRMEPGPDYAVWYAQTEVCAGVSGDFEAVRWFEVPGERWWDPLRQQFAIATWRRPHDIYITTAHLGDELVVKHEVVHDLLRGGDQDDVRFEQCSQITH